MIKEFSSLPNRYFSQATGVKAADFIFERASKYAPTSRFAHNWKQPSIIARINGTSEETVILGAHLDSISQSFFGKMTAPGADDDATGSMTLLEILRIVTEQGFKPKRSIEFVSWVECIDEIFC